MGNFAASSTIAQVNSILDEIGVQLGWIYLSNIEEHIVRRFIFHNQHIIAPNPHALLDFEDVRHAYTAYMINLAALAVNDNCLLIRFVMAYPKRGVKVGIFPLLTYDIGFVDEIVNAYCRSPERYKSLFDLCSLGR